MAYKQHKRILFLQLPLTCPRDDCQRRSAGAGRRNLHVNVASDGLGVRAEVVGLGRILRRRLVIHALHCGTHQALSFWPISERP